MCLRFCARGAGDHVTLLREEIMSADEHQRWLRTRPGPCSARLCSVRAGCVRERRGRRVHAPGAGRLSRCLFPCRSSRSCPACCPACCSLSVHALGMCVRVRACRTNEMVGARVQGATGTGGCQGGGAARAAQVGAARRMWLSLPHVVAACCCPCLALHCRALPCALACRRLLRVARAGGTRCVRIAILRCGRACRRR